MQCIARWRAIASRFLLINRFLNTKIERHQTCRRLAAPTRASRRCTYSPFRQLPLPRGMAMSVRGQLAALWLIVATATYAGAQGGTTAAITGIVSDRHGRSLAAAEIEVVNRATGFTSRVRSREDGRYNISGLEVGGPYSIIARHVGHQMRQQGNVYLRLGESLRADMQLDEEAVTLEAVVTSANEAGAWRAQTGVGTHVSDAQVHRLPTADRDLYGFLRLVPQVSTSYGPSAAGTSPRM